LPVPLLTATELDGDIVPPVPAVAVILYVLAVKVAVTAKLLLIDKEHAPVPVQPPPDQPPNVEPLAAEVVRVTTEPGL